MPKPKAQIILDVLSSILATQMRAAAAGAVLKPQGGELCGVALCKFLPQEGLICIIQRPPQKGKKILDRLFCTVVLWYDGSRISPRKGGAHHAAQSQNRLFPCRCQLRLFVLDGHPAPGNGETLDLRTVPAVVGGDEEKAHAWCWPRAFPPNGTASKPGNRCLWRAANTPI